MIQLIIRLIAFFKSERDGEREPRESLQYEGMTPNEWLQRMSRNHILYLNVDYRIGNENQRKLFIDCARKSS